MIENNPYIVNEKPIIINSFCAFIDILGTEERISNLKHANQELMQLFSTIKEIKHFLDKDKCLDKNIPDLWRYKIFSDNIVFGFPNYIEFDSESDFGQAITILSFFQINLAIRGYFLRGGLTFGPLFIGDETIFGSALVDAYNIERSIAVTPRIVLSESVMKQVRKHIKYYCKKRESPHYRSILIDSDNLPFINYLIVTFDEEKDNQREILISHKTAIENNLSKFSENSKIKAKYLWVAVYHNYFCELYQKHFGDIKDLLLRSELINLKPRTL